MFYVDDLDDFTEHGVDAVNLLYPQYRSSRFLGLGVVAIARARAIRYTQALRGGMRDATLFDANDAELCLLLMEFCTSKSLQSSQSTPHLVIGNLRVIFSRWLFQSDENILFISNLAKTIYEHQAHVSALTGSSGKVNQMLAAVRCAYDFVMLDWLKDSPFLGLLTEHSLGKIIQYWAVVYGQVARCNAAFSGTMEYTNLYFDAMRVLGIDAAIIPVVTVDVLAHAGYDINELRECGLLYYFINSIAHPPIPVRNERYGQDRRIQGATYRKALPALFTAQMHDLFTREVYVGRRLPAPTLNESRYFPNFDLPPREVFKYLQSNIIITISPQRPTYIFNHDG